MKDRSPVLFFCLAVAGLALIYTAAGNVEPETLKISFLDGSMVGEYVEITGYVESADFTGKNIVVKLSDGDKYTTVVVFEDLKNSLGGSAYSLFSTGSVVSVKGVVDEYKGLLEIIPNRVSDVRKLAK